MPVVLVIDDEDALRAAIAHALADVPGVTLTEAANMAQATSSLDRTPPDMILADIDLPDRPGIEILGELGKRGLQVPVVFVSAYLTAYRPQIPRNPLIEVLPKPVSMADVRQLVISRLGTTTSEATTDDAAPFRPEDFIQIACIGRHSVCIELRRGDQTVASATVVDGELWTAEAGSEIGETALPALLFAAGSRTHCRSLTGTLPARTITRHWEHALLDAARSRDEEHGGPPGRCASQPTPRPILPDVREDPVETAFRHNWEQAVDALLARDHTAAYRAFLRADLIKPGDERVAANLHRLRELGFESEDGPDVKES